MPTNYIHESEFIQCWDIMTLLLYTVDKIQFVSGSNYAYSMWNKTLPNRLLFLEIFIVVLFTSKDFSATVFTVGEKAMSHQTHNQNTKIKGAIHIISTYLEIQICVQILLWV